MDACGLQLPVTQKTDHYYLLAALACGDWAAGFTCSVDGALARQVPTSGFIPSTINKKDPDPDSASLHRQRSRFLRKTVVNGDPQVVRVQNGDIYHTPPGLRGAGARGVGDCKCFQGTSTCHTRQGHCTPELSGCDCIHETRTRSGQPKDQPGLGRGLQSPAPR